jgi:capsular polysaccharide biosynthesis protein
VTGLILKLRNYMAQLVKLIQVNTITCTNENDTPLVKQARRALASEGQSRAMRDLMQWLAERDERPGAIERAEDRRQDE